MDSGEKYHIQHSRQRAEYIKKRELDPDEETTLMYAPFPKHKPGINAESSGFRSRMTMGLNKQESIFDSTAVFRTT